MIIDFVVNENMTNENGLDIIKKLKKENRKEDERFEDMTSALVWLKSQLKTLKEQDKKLMKKFREIRTQINSAKESEECSERSRERAINLKMVKTVVFHTGRSLFNIYHIEDETFLEAQRANYHPFDEEPDDGKSLRRRALSMELHRSNKALHKSFKEDF